MIGVDVSGVVPGCLNAAYHRSLRAEPVLPVLLARPVRKRSTELFMPSADKCAEWAACARRLTDAVDAVVDLAADRIRSGHYKGDGDDDLQLAPDHGGAKCRPRGRLARRSARIYRPPSATARPVRRAPNPWALESVMGSKMAEVVKMAGGEQAR